MRNHYENNKFQNTCANTPNAAAAIVFLISAGLAFITLFSLIVTALSAAFLAFRILKALKEYPVRVKASLDALSACMSEISDVLLYYEENRAKKNELLSVVEFI